MRPGLFADLYSAGWSWNGGLGGGGEGEREEEEDEVDEKNRMGRIRKDGEDI